MSEFILALDAVQYVKLEALAEQYHVSVESLLSIFLDSWVGTTSMPVPVFAKTA
jgi:hypothetical protein